ncbi:PspC domain-containing protein [Methanosalsum natronophilum]|uniref:PspC domain-containing protein n=1 Tax=Methanosalsum natronophilum TaxID=768733 RepID=A0A3R8C9B5_9EURY|nr:PspC domain-containing protein [Methanosalsum natronophilum]MCS3924816.1 phage shock protein PspC (stress-responsive transcriptional regulator) [Methanosalsum natronophilum]RQD82090.1 MAG: PspC domain-containing protein [Methanosalsum natronophilum]
MDDDAQHVDESEDYDNFNNSEDDYKEPISNSSEEQNVKKVLKRSKNDRVLAGVCGGIGEYANLDPIIVRIIFVILTLMSFGTGVLLYIILAIVIPEEN